jgi:NAD(P)H-flavin reductase
MAPKKYRIRSVRRETHDTFSLVLEPGEGTRVPTFLPGQFNMLYVFGVGEVPISFSGDPSEEKTYTHTIRSVGKVTEAIKRLKKGDIIGVRGPFGSHWPTEDLVGKDIVIVAGGMGLAPLRPAITQLLADRGNYGRITILYGSRSPKDILYRNELEKWRGRFDLDVAVTVDRGTGDWFGDVGVVTNLIPGAEFDLLESAALVCGPELMMRFTISELATHGIPKDSIYISMERNMKCGIGLCGHCQFGPYFVCKDGPVFRFADVEPFFNVREV